MAAELESRMTAEYRADVRTVWAVVTDNDDSTWRSDLDRIECEDDLHFTEYTKKGEATRFTITAKEDCALYAFDLENGFLSGKWTGEFAALPEGGTRIVFTERVKLRNPIVALVARMTGMLRKMQDTYAADLRRRLGE